MAGAKAAHGQAHTTNPPFVHFRARQQIIHRTNVIPKDDARPGETSRINGAPDKLLALAGALIESGDAFRLDIIRPFTPVRRVVVEEHSPFAPIEHVQHQDDIPLTREFQRQTPAAVIGTFEIRQDRVLVLRFRQLLLAPEVKAAVIVQRDDGRRR